MEATGLTLPVEIHDEGLSKGVWVENRESYTGTQDTEGLASGSNGYLHEDFYL